ncbi:tubulin-specific chaperone E [Corythoichthys intestinalis]|uniref:tubulin-specific chaperone E n=1 Tax=Corythoichthys intestinalis TaxID=161448 RepID=UPI0025A51BA1|nr:tubulin-specific chaperone E [Corythoichthys intestinalis]XP_061792334.1 tubulin-specific chaperone E-like [Nerophis lumbriciformis]
MAAELPEDALGRRVLCGQHRATVRFVGAVPPTEGVWLGVEWDDPTRGKHDGSREGVRYFTCSHPTGGSFVRPSKASFGADFLSVLRQRYDDEESDEEIKVSGKTLKWTEVKERSLESFSVILLENCPVNGPGVDGQIRQTTPNVRWLNLSGSLLCGWDDVAAVARQLEHLEGLHLSFNRLRLPSEIAAHRGAFNNLRVLTLMSCRLTWTQVLECAPMWPHLEELIVEDNDITRLHRPEGVFGELRCLDLSKNPLQQDSLLNLAHLPRLQHLIMTDTDFCDIRFPDAAPGAETSSFASLENLNLSCNRISEWRVIDELGKLPSLRQLWCRGNFLVSDDRNPKTANQMLIAKLPHLCILNGTEVTLQERKGAECDYLKMFGEEWMQSVARSPSRREFSNRHPRYSALVDKYGAPEEGELKKRQPFALKNQLLKITFVFADEESRTPLVKKLPVTMEVRKVKGLLARIMKVPVSDLKLSYTSAKVVGPEYDMDGDLKTLFFYNVEDGDTILVRRS